ncbi:uncharacterized protein BXZ73DRAFT_77442 [Epithele typhae]|uniref:uncharacterized protein n=1 Tax=Epithele typhae TaxID=378194 RepID=UPI00200747B5|nr:uncharacterized protein BXZ73DRAFT_77442 [Epithele typhae]KAH9932735.1 hypothetical protein BXZ73DRAFT_77442 [Epithele typhae]
MPLIVSTPASGGVYNNSSISNFTLIQTSATGENCEHFLYVRGLRMLTLSSLGLLSSHPYTLWLWIVLAVSAAGFLAIAIRKGTRAVNSLTQAILAAGTTALSDRTALLPAPPACTPSDTPTPSEQPPEDSGGGNHSGSAGFAGLRTASQRCRAKVSAAGKFVLGCVFYAFYASMMVLGIVYAGDAPSFELPAPVLAVRGGPRSQ